MPVDPFTLSAHSPLAAAISHLFIGVLIVLGVILLIVAFLVTYNSMRFRDRPGAQAPRQVFGSRRLEIAWTLAPMLLLAVIFAFTVRTMGVSDPPPGDREPDIVVIGHQWWWEVHYPQSGVVTANEIHIPAGRALLARMESADVIHDFWVPQLARMIDVIPGHINHIWLQADTPGIYLGTCAEFCGAEHAWMRIRVVAQPQDQYDQWTRGQIVVPGRPTGTAAEGARVFATRTCINCHAIAGTAANQSFGPDLTHFASRATLGAGAAENTHNELVRWLHDPDLIKPASNMPNLQLSQSEVDTLAAYLESLK